MVAQKPRHVLSSRHHTVGILNSSPSHMCLLLAAVPPQDFSSSLLPYNDQRTVDRIYRSKPSLSGMRQCRSPNLFFSTRTCSRYTLSTVTSDQYRPPPTKNGVLTRGRTIVLTRGNLHFGSDLRERVVNLWKKRRVARRVEGALHHVPKSADSAIWIAGNIGMR